MPLGCVAARSFDGDGITLAWAERFPAVLATASEHGEIAPYRVIAKSADVPVEVLRVWFKSVLPLALVTNPPQLPVGSRVQSCSFSGVPEIASRLAVKLPASKPARRSRLS
jgi:hypothetical protein